MNFNSEGLKLVKRFEGKRLRAYKDPVGIWTIGYGHTSMAGAPHVRAGLTISASEASNLLMTDMKKYSNGIRRHIKVKLTDNQFSALCSFAYNVGVGAFKRSSVLREVNRRNFSKVPSRLNLWVKAGGKTLKGLVRRRHAEGELFMLDHSYDIVNLSGTEIGPIEGKSNLTSTTNIAAATAGVTSIGAIADQVSTAATVAKDAKDNILGLGVDMKTLLLIGACVVIAGCVVWIIKERAYKSKHEGV